MHHFSNRPSLDEIAAHPFFSHDAAKIPVSIPLSATHVPPDWREDDQGMIYAVEKESDEEYRHPKIAILDAADPKDEFPTPQAEVEAILNGVAAAAAEIENVDPKDASAKQSSLNVNKPSLPAKKSGGDGMKRGRADAVPSTQDKMKGKGSANTASASAPLKTCTNTDGLEKESGPHSKSGDRTQPTSSNVTSGPTSANVPGSNDATLAPTKAKKTSKQKKKKTGKKNAEPKRNVPPQDAPVPMDVPDEEKKDENEPLVGGQDIALEPKAEDGNDDAKLMTAPEEVKELSPEAKARAQFWQQERDHQEMYTFAMEEWAVAEYARQQTQEQRYSEDADAFNRAYIDPEEVKENNKAFMMLLAKQCGRAYKALYGHRTGGTVKIVDSSDVNLIGRFGKIVDQNNPPGTFKIELQPTKAEKMAAKKVEFATVAPSDIEMAQSDESKATKKRSKKGVNSKKKTKKAASKSGMPAEYTFDLTSACSFEATITTSNLDELTADLADLIYVLDSMMAKRNEAEDAELKQMEEELLKKEAEYAASEEREYSAQAEESVKMVKRCARKARSMRGIERVPLSERLGLGGSFGGVDSDSLGMARFMLDAMTDFYDAYGPGSPFRAVGMGREIDTIFHLLADIDDTGMALSFLLRTTKCMRLNGRIFVMYAGDIPVASFDAKDPRCDFFKKSEGEEEALEEEDKLDGYADLLGVSPDASEKEVKKAFRKKALQYHPDKFDPSDGMSKEEGEEKFKELSNASEYMLRNLVCVNGDE